jgi:hypothetical protein
MTFIHTIRRLGTQGALLGGLALLASCEGATPVSPTTLVGAEIQVAAGDQQTGTVLSRVAEPVRIRIVSATGAAVSGAEVRAASTVPGLRVTPTAVRTDSRGEARFDIVLGGTAGIQTVSFNLPEAPATPIRVISFEAVAGIPAGLRHVGGQDQMAPRLAELREPLQVMVVDAGGNPVADQRVEWRISSGTGRLSAANTITDATGRASVRWTLGAEEGQQQAVASFGATTAQFNAEAVRNESLVPARIRAVNPAQTQQTVPVETPLSVPLQVVVENSSGYPVTGAAVRWVVMAGEATAVGLAERTNTVGEASGRVTTGSSLTPIVIGAVAAGVLDTVRFTITPTAGPVQSLVLLAGPQQAATTAGQFFPDTYRVEARDIGGRIAQGRTLTIALAGGRGNLQPSVLTTDSLGQVSFQWRAGPSVGTDSLTIRRDAGALTLIGVVSAGGAATLSAVDAAPFTVATQGLLASPRAVRVRDANGNPVRGAPVTFRLTGAVGGTLYQVGGAVTSHPTTLTIPSDEQGIARVQYLAGATAGVTAIEATTPTTPTTVRWNGTVVEVILTALTPMTADTSTRGRTAPAAMGVRAVDAATGSAISGIGISFRHTLPGTVPTSDTVLVTDASGDVRVTPTYADSVFVGQLRWEASGQSVSRTIQLTDPSGAVRVIPVADTTTTLAAVSGQPWADSVRVIAVTASGARVANAPVHATVSSGVIAPGVTTTNANGVATFAVTAPTTLGVTQVVTARIPKSAEVVTYRAAITQSGQPVNLIVVRGGDQVGVPNQVLGERIAIKAVTSSGVPVPGTPVTWSVTQGSISPSAAVTDALGQVEAEWQLGATVGPQTLSVNLANTTALPVTVSATALDVNTVAFIERAPGISGDLQQGAANTLLANPIRVIVLNAARQPIAGQVVRFRVTGGSGVVASSPSGGTAQVTTDGSGMAIAYWTLGSNAVTLQTVEADLPAHPAMSPVLFRAYVVDGNSPILPYTITVDSLSQDMFATENMLTPRPLRAVVRNFDGSLASGVTVQFAIIRGIGSLLAPAPSGPFSLSRTAVSSSLGGVESYYEVGGWPTDGFGNPLSNALYSWQVEISIPSQPLIPPIVVNTYRAP